MTRHRSRRAATTTYWSAHPARGTGVRARTTFSRRLVRAGDRLIAGFAMQGLFVTLVSTLIFIGFHIKYDDGLASSRSPMRSETSCLPSLENNWCAPSVLDSFEVAEVVAGVRQEGYRCSQTPFEAEHVVFQYRHDLAVELLPLNKAQWAGKRGIGWSQLYCDSALPSHAHEFDEKLFS